MDGREGRAPAAHQERDGQLQLELKRGSVSELLPSLKYCLAVDRHPELNCCGCYFLHRVASDHSSKA